MRKLNQSTTYAFISVLLWSTVATSFKIGLRYLSPLFLILAAAVVSWFVFLIFLTATKRLSELSRVTLTDLGKSALQGLLNPCGYYLVLFHAYSLLPAQVAQPLNMIWPFPLALFSALLLKQHITIRNIAAIFVSLAGVVFISSQGSFSGWERISLPGVGLALGSSLLWALYWVLGVMDKREEVIKLFWSFSFGIVYLLLIAFTSGSPAPELNTGAMGASVYVGLFELGLTYILWMRAMQLSENNAKTGNLIFLAPFLSLVFIHFILGETIYSTTFVGLSLIIAGIWLQQRKK